MNKKQKEKKKRAEIKKKESKIRSLLTKKRADYR